MNSIYVRVLAGLMVAVFLAPVETAHTQRAPAGTAIMPFKIRVPDAVLTDLKRRLSQARFAQLLGVSLRTLQDWEQGRRAPSGAARTLLMVAAKNPQALLEVA